MIYSDHQIKALINQGLIESKWSDLVNPTSLDITIGKDAFLLVPEALSYTNKVVADKVGNHFIPKTLGEHSTISPADRYLLETEQYFKFPNHVCGQIRLKA